MSLLCAVQTGVNFADRCGETVRTDLLDHVLDLIHRLRENRGGAHIALRKCREVVRHREVRRDGAIKTSTTLPLIGAGECELRARAIEGRVGGNHIGHIFPDDQENIVRPNAVCHVLTGQRNGLTAVVDRTFDLELCHP
ncbi:hypothetical protein [Burkholderia cepacia]|uniref:hypothetical protein n=1 Tax=Burkholderia cepacia TaxID=292 RepID=UPI0012D9A915|nr:hypothetical protein [Burkholderia cepacia]